MIPRNPIGVSSSDIAYTPPRDPRLKQHRCHPRTADFVATLLRLEFGSTPHRARLLYRCLVSDVGAEPSDTFLVDPAEHALKQKLWLKKGEAGGREGGGAAQK